jgi:hypothetical protein
MKVVVSRRAAKSGRRGTVRRWSDNKPSQYGRLRQIGASANEKGAKCDSFAQPLDNPMMR